MQNFVTTMQVGAERTRVFVNSADSRGRGAIDDMLGGLADHRGSVAWAVVEREYGADAVLGRVAIRERFREVHGPVVGTAIGAERARQLLRTYPADQWHGIAITRQNSPRLD